MPSQDGQDTDLCHQQTNQTCLSRNAAIDAEEEALTLDYQPDTKQHIPEQQGMCVSASNKNAPKSSSISDSSSVGGRSHTGPQKSHRQRVWRNKHHRRDGVMDLWTRAGLRLQCKAVK